MSEPYRVLVTGSRTWTDRAMVELELDGLLAQYGVLVVIHGAARKGPDSMAQNWGLSRRHASSYGAVVLEPHRADWNRHGRRAGMIRNGEMVQAGAHACRAFIMPCELPSCRRAEPHGTHGASHCADLAEKAGIETLRFTSA